MSSILSLKANSKPQHAFLASSEYEVLFGGSSGGGKTEGIILDPIRYVKNSDFKAIIFRESFKELEKAVLPEAMKIYNAGGARWNEAKRRFTWGSGAFIDLGYLENVNDWQSYQGTQYVGQYFDELTNIRWGSYEKLGIWNRAASGGIKPYRRSASNPGGISHSEVKAYFIETCPAEKDGPPVYSELARMQWQPMKAGKRFVWTAENGMQLTRRYIPARVFDNEDLLRNNPLYLAQLLKLDPQTRKAYLEGDWDIFEGQFFNFRRDHHLIDWKYNPAFNKLGGMDYGNITALEVLQRDYNGTIVIAGECYMPNFDTPTERAECLADYLLEQKFYKLDINCDTDMWNNQISNVGYEKTPVEIFNQVLKRRMGDKAPTLLQVNKTSLDKNKLYRQSINDVVKDYLLIRKSSDGTPYSQLYVNRSCVWITRAFTELIHDPNNPDGMDYDNTHPMRHQFDGFKYAFQALCTPDKPKPQIPNWLKEEIEKQKKSKSRSFMTV
jgi:hypothetical protein